MKKTIEKYTEDINSQYPQYSEYTSYCAEQLTDLLICDYNSFPSENKSTRYVKSVLKEIITYAFMNVGIKNYLKLIIKFFDISEVKTFFSEAKIDTNQLYKTVDNIKNRINYWQGFENSSPETHLNYLLEPLN